MSYMHLTARELSLDVLSEAIAKVVLHVGISHTYKCVSIIIMFSNNNYYDDSDANDDDDDDPWG